MHLTEFGGITITSTPTNFHQSKKQKKSKKNEKKEDYNQKEQKGRHSESSLQHTTSNTPS